MKLRQLTQQFASALNEALPADKVYNNQYFSEVGYTDPTKPAERRIKRDLVGVFFRGLYQRADEVSGFMLKAKVMRRTAQQEMEHVEFDHPWPSLLRSPSSLYSPVEVWQWAQLNYDLNGAADFLNVYDNRNRLVELVPLYREFGEIYPLPSPQGGVMGWLFQRSDGKRYRVEKDVFTRIARRNPNNPYETLTLIEAARAELDEDEAMRKYRQRSTAEGGWEAEQLHTDKELSTKQHQELSKEYKQFLGERGRGRVAVFSHGIKPLQMMNARDLEYIEGKAQTVEAIKDILGTKGLGEGAQTRATAEAVRYDFIESTISPLVRLHCSQLSRAFEVAFNADRDVLIIEPPEMSPLDPDFELRKRRSYLETGQRTINDYLRMDGEDEVPDGDRRFIPIGWRELANDEGQRQVRSTRNDDDKERAWRNIDEKKRRQSSLTQPAIRDYFEMIERETLKNFRGKSRDLQQAFTEPFDLSEMMAKWEGVITPEIERSLRAAYDNIADTAGITGLEFSLDSTQVQRAIRQIARQQSTVPETLFAQMDETIRKGIKDGESNVAIMDSIKDYYTDTAPGQILNIANGLSTASWESGQDVAYHEAGIRQKVWLSSRDGAVRDDHFNADGQQVDVNDSFDVGGEKLKYPGDPDGSASNVIGCRCSTQPVL